jgi:hypothetical protein
VNVEAPLALATTDPDRPGLEIRVNFGVFAGRGATPAEIDDLARELIPAVGEVSIVAEERHELSDASEASLNQVRIEVDADRLPRSPSERDALIRRLVDASGRWAEACIADRHAEVSEL